jgi:hypothetical protein
MSKRPSSNYRTMRTTEGIVFHLYTDESGKNKPHSQNGPAILYPKGINKPDEYYIYGIKYTYDKWLELSRPARKSSSDSEDFTE